MGKLNDTDKQASGRKVAIVLRRPYSQCESMYVFNIYNLSVFKVFPFRQNYFWDDPVMVNGGPCPYR